MNALLSGCSPSASSTSCTTSASRILAGVGAATRAPAELLHHAGVPSRKVLPSYLLPAFSAKEQAYRRALKEMERKNRRRRRPTFMQRKQQHRVISQYNVAMALQQTLCSKTDENGVPLQHRVRRAQGADTLSEMNATPKEPQQLERFRATSQTFNFQQAPYRVGEKADNLRQGGNSAASGDVLSSEDSSKNNSTTLLDSTQVTALDTLLHRLRFELKKQLKAESVACSYHCEGIGRHVISLSWRMPAEVFLSNGKMKSGTTSKSKLTNDRWWRVKVDEVMKRLLVIPNDNIAHASTTALSSANRAKHNKLSVPHVLQRFRVAKYAKTVAVYGYRNEDIINSSSQSVGNKTRHQTGGKIKKTSTIYRLRKRKKQVEDGDVLAICVAREAVPTEEAVLAQQSRGGTLSTSAARNDHDKSASADEEKNGIEDDSNKKSKRTTAEQSNFLASPEVVLTQFLVRRFGKLRKAAAASGSVPLRRQNLLSDDHDVLPSVAHIVLDEDLDTAVLRDLHEKVQSVSKFGNVTKHGFSRGPKEQLQAGQKNQNPGLILRYLNTPPPVCFVEEEDVDKEIQQTESTTSSSSGGTELFGSGSSSPSHSANRTRKTTKVNTEFLHRHVLQNLHEHLSGDYRVNEYADCWRNSSWCSSQDGVRGTSVASKKREQSRESSIGLQPDADHPLDPLSSPRIPAPSTPLRVRAFDVRQLLQSDYFERTETTKPLQMEFIKDLMLQSSEDTNRKRKRFKEHQLKQLQQELEKVRAGGNINKSRTHNPTVSAKQRREIDAFFAKENKQGKNAARGEALDAKQPGAAKFSPGGRDVDAEVASEKRADAAPSRKSTAEEDAAAKKLQRAEEARIIEETKALEAEIAALERAIHDEGS
ncbi:unnamed protein product [Amoebophrya sp. A120]|nr:unnamed protein product [Amoebophrya sp. A120]|eukprot:GSA120T00007080001.1